MEAKFKDVEFAKKAYTKIVKRIIDAGVRYSSLPSLFSVLVVPGETRHTLPCATGPPNNSFSQYIIHHT